MREPEPEYKVTPKELAELVRSQRRIEAKVREAQQEKLLQDREQARLADAHDVPWAAYWISLEDGRFHPGRPPNGNGAPMPMGPPVEIVSGPPKAVRKRFP